MYNPYVQSSDKIIEAWRDIKHIQAERDQAAFERFMKREANKLGQVSQRLHNKIVVTSSRDTVILLWFLIDALPNLQPYLRQLVEDGARRVFKYRYNPHMLSFSDNEAIMLSRLYEGL